jgi:putative tricarboxylic transport membrane protein
MGIFELYDGLGIVSVIMGLFGISEVLVNLEKRLEKPEIIGEKISHIYPTLHDWTVSIGAILRGTVVGFFLGVLPGGGALLATFASYAVEKRFSKYPEKFGQGVIEGVAGPESANNAAAQASFIPMLTLGIPPTAPLAIMMGALMIHNIIPGPLLMANHPDVFWGVVCSMYIGNVMLLVLNLPMLGLWVKVLKIPYSILFPLILLVCLIGSYSANGSLVDMTIMILFGIIGYLMKKFDYQIAPVVLGMILGGMMEPALRRSLMMSNGRFSIFFNRPISLVLMIATGILLVSPLALRISRRLGKQQGNRGENR